MGYVVSEKGKKPDHIKIAVIYGLATPTNTKAIVKLLGHVSWYRELIPHCAKIAVPITQLLKKHCKIVWTDICQKVFEELSSRLSIYPVLRPSDWGKPFHVFGDASNVAVGSVLC